MAEPHVLVVGEPLDPDLIPQFEVECPGVTDDCRMWAECAVSGCPPFTQGTEAEDEAIDEGGYTAHGVEHKRLTVGWCVRTEQCFIRDHDELPDAVNDLFGGWDRAALGRYPVRINWSDAQDDTELHLELLEAASNGA